MTRRGRQWAFAAGLTLLATAIATADGGEYQIFHAFDANAPRAAVHGLRPAGPLLQRRDGSICGTTRDGGAHGAGTLFAIDANGRLRVLHAFAAGSHPVGALIEAENGRVYGVTSSDRSAAAIVYALGTDDRVTPLVTFEQYAAGGTPIAGLTEGSDGFLYGVAASTGDAGSIFRMSFEGALTVLHELRSGGAEGANPAGALVEFADGNFYGATATGGAHAAGAVIRVTPKGEVTVVHAFDPRTEGASPAGGLVPGPDGSFFGVLTASSKSYAGGAVYRIAATGDFAIVHDFTGADGDHPIGELTPENDGSLLGNGWLVGVTRTGGPHFGGTLYRLDTRHGGVVVLHSFGGRGDASAPAAGVIQASDGALYGPTDDGAGAIYRLRPAARIAR